MSQTLIERYREFLPVTSATPVISLGEGRTPLVKAANLPAYFQAPKLQLYFKLEGLNPTGSFKDRGMTMSMSKALEAGSAGIICASTGNTSASAAAFAAKAKLPCYVLLPAGHVAQGKLAQALLYGSHVIPVNGNYDQALDMVRAVAESMQLTVVNAINPFRLEGQKTAAFEVLEVLDDAPDYLFIPVGNAGNMCAYWRGFKQWHDAGRAKRTPAIFGFEAEGAAAIVRGQPINNPETVATAIRIGKPTFWKEAEAAAKESKGRIDCVSDEEILDAYKLLARSEGIFCEPSSAASLAGLIKSLKLGLVPQDATCVCVLTGNGLKDPDNAIRVSKEDLTPIPPEPEALKKALLTHRPGL
jgi:threonine synthase